MELNQLIAQSSTIITITKLQKGDVYKRVQEAAYAGAKAELKYGVVQGVMNNGTDSAITALEYTAGYQTLTVEQKVFTGSQPVAIFPATTEEVRVHLDAIEKSVTDALEAKQRELIIAERNVEAIYGVRLSLTEGTLSEPEVIQGRVDSEALEPGVVHR